jgi:hypothetical protein
MPRLVRLVRLYGRRVGLVFCCSCFFALFCVFFFNSWRRGELRSGELRAQVVGSLELLLLLLLVLKLLLLLLLLVLKLLLLLLLVLKPLLLYSSISLLLSSLMSSSELDGTDVRDTFRGILVSTLPLLLLLLLLLPSFELEEVLQETVVRESRSGILLLRGVLVSSLLLLLLLLPSSSSLLRIFQTTVLRGTLRGITLPSLLLSLVEPTLLVGDGCLKWPTFFN